MPYDTQEAFIGHVTAILGLSTGSHSAFEEIAPVNSGESIGPVQVFTTEAGNRFGIWPKTPTVPAPTNFIPAVNARATRLLDYLIAQGYTDPEKIAACGISRGGFLAMHFAASDPRIKCAAVFAPVINLGTLPYFKGAEQHPAVRSVDLMKLPKNSSANPFGS